VVVDWIPWSQIGSEGGPLLTRFEYSNSIKFKDFLYRLGVYYSYENDYAKGIGSLVSFSN
jgi:hypothetical protein